MPLLANAVVNTTRNGVAVLSNLSLRIWSESDPIEPIGELLHQAPLKYIADFGTNIQIGDQVQGYNPYALSIPPIWAVRQATTRAGLLPHIAGTLILTPDPARLAQFQSIAQAFMPDTCLILRLAVTSDNQGGWSPTFTTVGTAACRLSPLAENAEEIPVANELAALTRWLLAVPIGTDIRPSDRVQVNNQLFEVKGPLITPTWEIERHIILEQVLRQ